MQERERSWELGAGSAGAAWELGAGARSCWSYGTLELGSWSRGLELREPSWRRYGAGATGSWSCGRWSWSWALELARELELRSRWKPRDGWSRELMELRGEAGAAGAGVGAEEPGAGAAGAEREPRSWKLEPGQQELVLVAAGSGLRNLD